MLLHSLHAILYFSSLRMSLKCTCINFGILCRSMTPSINLRLTRRNDSNLPWKSSEISFRFSPRVPVDDFLAALPSEEDLYFLKRTHSCHYASNPLGYVPSEKCRLCGNSGKTSSIRLKTESTRSKKKCTTLVLYSKIARKFKKASPSKKDSDLVRVHKEPVQKGKQVKRPTKKSTTKPAIGIELISEVALTEEALMKEVRKKSLREFHKTHPSGSSTVVVKPPSVDKVTPTVTSEGTGDKPGVPDVTEDDSTESESESLGNDEDDSINDDQDSSNEDSEQENESEEQVSDSEQEEE
ncbi:hypothetical protein Tco_0532154 [Tanacetum coccineum]